VKKLLLRPKFNCTSQFAIYGIKNQKKIFGQTIIIIIALFAFMKHQRIQNHLLQMSQIQIII